MYVLKNLKAESWWELQAWLFDSYRKRQVRLHTYLIDHSPLGLFRANETNNWNKLNRLRIRTGRRQTSSLCTSAAEELNQGLPETNTASGQSGTSRFQIRRPNHSATLPLSWMFATRVFVSPIFIFHSSLSFPLFPVPNSCIFLPLILMLCCATFSRLFPSGATISRVGEEQFSVFAPNAKVLQETMAKIEELTAEEVSNIYKTQFKSQHTLWFLVCGRKPLEAELRVNKVNTQHRWLEIRNRTQATLLRSVCSHQSTNAALHTWHSRRVRLHCPFPDCYHPRYYYYYYYYY